MFMMLFDLTLILVIAGFVFWCFNKTAFLNMFGFGRAQAGKAGRYVKTIDPMSGLQQAEDDAAAKIKTARYGLSNVAAAIAKLNREIAEMVVERERLEHRIKTAQEIGDKNCTARSYAIRLGEVRQTVQKRKAALERYQGMYQKFRNQIVKAEMAVMRARERSASLNTELKYSNAQRILQTAVSDIDFDSDSLVSAMAEAEALIMDQIDANNADMQVSDDLSPDRSGEEADDRSAANAEAEEILREFAPAIVEAAVRDELTGQDQSSSSASSDDSDSGSSDSGCDDSGSGDSGSDSGSDD